MNYSSVGKLRAGLQLLKTKKGRRTHKQQMKATAVKARQSISGGGKSEIWNDNGLQTSGSHWLEMIFI